MVNKWDCPVCGYNVSTYKQKKEHIKVTVNDAQHREHLAVHLRDKIVEMAEDDMGLDNKEDAVDNGRSHLLRFAF